LGTVGLKHFFAFTASTPAKSGFLQGRSALRVWLRGIFVALGFYTRRNIK
jgi:hypothetical protein